MSVIYADLGGTHLRLARADMKVECFTIADHPDMESLLRRFAPDMDALYLASAIHPLDGVIEDKRFGCQSPWRTDLEALKAGLNLKKLVVFNDLEAAAHALGALEEGALRVLLPRTRAQIYFERPPRLLIGIGTGIGHAFAFDDFVQRTHGGHVPALAVSGEQMRVIAVLKDMKGGERDLIVEDIVSGNGYANLQKIVSEKEALRLFWEFLGLYCHVIAGLAGSYGGIYLTGGVIDAFVEKGWVDMTAFAAYFHRPMVSVVRETLAATPVYYCHDVNLPIVGLARVSGA